MVCKKKSNCKDMKQLRKKEEIVMMKNLTLEHIAAACHGTYYGSEEKKSQCIEAVTTDSRKVERGCLLFDCGLQGQMIINLLIR